MSALLLTLTRINLWHFVWIAVVLSVLLSLLLSELIHRQILWQYPFGATLIALTVASVLMYVIKRMFDLKQTLTGALRESQERFSSAFRDAAIGMALVGTDGRWLQVNPALCELVGYTEQELLATTFQAITHPDDLDADLTFVRQMLAGEIRTYQMEKRYLHKQGHVIWILLSVSLVRDAFDQPLYFIGQIQDITERKRVEEELGESKARLQAILDHSPNMVFLKDLAGRYLLVNRQFEAAFHLTSQDIAGKTDDEIFPPEQAIAFRANDRKVLQAGVPLQFEEVALHDDGPHTSLVFKFPLCTKDGRPYALCGITTDITERKEAVESLREIEQRLRQALEERERLSQDLHDNVIQSIYAIGMALESCHYLIEKDPGLAVQRLRSSIADLNGVMKEVRNYIEWASPTVTHSGQLQEAFEQLVRTIPRARPLAMALAIDPSAVGQLTAEEAMHVLQITREAISNSLRHSGAKTGGVSLSRTAGGLRLDVHDDGIGFDTTSGAGHGLGLRNMAARAGKLKADLTVLSEPGRGTRIILTIPKEHDHASAPHEIHPTTARG